MTPTWLSTGMVALMLLAPTPSSGQQDTLTAGQRVLVQVTSAFARSSPPRWRQRRHVGTAVTVGDSMTLTVGAESMALSLSDVERLWVSEATGRRSAYAAKGAGMGLLFGVVLGLSLGESCSEERFICYTRGELAAGFGAGGAVGGALLGAAMGGERWRELLSFRQRLSLFPNGGGVTVRAVFAP